MSLSERIREAREATGRSQRALARKLDIRQATLSDWETDKCTPTAGNLRLLADEFANGRAVYEWLRDGGDRPPLRLGAEPGDQAGSPTPLLRSLQRWLDRQSLSVELLKELKSDLEREAAGDTRIHRILDAAISASEAAALSASGAHEALQKASREGGRAS